MTPDVLSAIEEGSIDPAAFDHRAHVEAAWLLATRCKAPFHEAYARLRAALLALATRAGRPDKYHETITLAFLSLVYERLAEGGSASCFDQFWRDEAASLTMAHLNARLGSALSSPAARFGLVLPPAPKHA